MTTNQHRAFRWFQIAVFGALVAFAFTRIGP